MQSLPLEADRLLSDFLRDNEIVAAEALHSGATNDQGVVYTLVKNGLLSEEDVARRFADAFGFDVVNLSEGQVMERPLQDTISKAFIKNNRVLPYLKEGETLRVAITDPKGLRHVSELKMMTGLEVKTDVALLSVFDMLDHEKSKGDGKSTNVNGKPSGSLYTDDDHNKKDANGVSVESLHDEEEEAPANHADDSESVDLNQNLGRRATDKKKDKAAMASAGSDVIECVNNILTEAISIGTSDIHIETFRDGARVRYRKDGVLQEMEGFAEFLMLNYSAVVTRIKIMASLDISERRLPQDGAISTDLAERMVDIRVSVLPAVHGERVVMRILDPDMANFSLSQLGMAEKPLRAFEKAIRAPQGMVLVTGPTGSGKSTTLYAGLKELNEVGINIMTAEDPVEYDLSGIGQVQVKEHIGLTFASALRSFLRQDPEVIMVGEIRDKETSDIAMKAALTGHLVLSTLHTNDAPSTITRMVNMGVPAYLITAALSLVVAQRLARKNCTHCAKEVEVHKEELVGIGFTEAEATSMKTKKAEGCDHCGGTGILGRQAIHEVLSVTDDIRDAILAGASDKDIKEIAVKEGFETMQETGRNLVKDGTISVDEYKRILVLD